MYIRERIILPDNNPDLTLRFSEASFIKELEAQGVGRPSTYASIIGTLRTRTYVNVQASVCRKQLSGCRSCDILVQI